ncbi:probable phosphatase phospho2 [Neocloeon triangulifer]|uniref:probable phosphatase phospho2 n=1 Tax=Neocloeon triangulifer TaxID=2078957 RepID=UPI00286F59D4|nr:probable phosphatase phospho2 [Neocloeon triangulifer]XP_059485497.1 probable phosphatase phospho2 [Neocloeon triangulifer]
MMRRLLMAFDFDHTIINDNSDIVVRNMLGSPIPEEVAKLYRTDGWTAYMQSIFKLLNTDGFSPLQLQSAIKQIPYTPGMDALLEGLHQRGDAEVIIISDSNSVFIRDWLEHASVDHIVNKTFTNPAHFDDEGLLNIKMYHEQDWCTLSTKNLCKGHILQSYVNERAKEGVKFDCIGYVGDGNNDLCPCLKLSQVDLAFPRKDYSLAKMISKEDFQHKIEAGVHIWESGHEILEVIRKHLPPNP